VNVVFAFFANVVFAFLAVDVNVVFAFLAVDVNVVFAFFANAVFAFFANVVFASRFVFANSELAAEFWKREALVCVGAFSLILFSSSTVRFSISTLFSDKYTRTLPVPQLEQNTLPFIAASRPKGHAKQTREPVSLVNVPVWQSSHDFPGNLPNFPAGHFWQELLP
jgi:hypothetical protein